MSMMRVSQNFLFLMFLLSGPAVRIASGLELLGEAGTDGDGAVAAGLAAAADRQAAAAADPANAAADPEGVCLLSVGSVRQRAVLASEKGHGPRLHEKTQHQQQMHHHHHGHQGRDHRGAALISEGQNANAESTEVLRLQLGRSAVQWREWVQKQEQLSARVMKTGNDFDSFMASQRGTSGACGLRMMRAKEMVDQMTKEASDLTREITGYEQILGAETQSLNITAAEIQAVEADAVERGKQCEADAKEAGEDFDQYSQEREELEQMADPALRYDVATGTYSSFLDPFGKIRGGDGVYCSGKELKRIENIATAEACREACLEFDGCKGYTTYFKSNAPMHCLLFDDCPDGGQATSYTGDIESYRKNQACSESMSGSGMDYRGCQEKTRQGFTCAAWTSPLPTIRGFHPERFQGVLGNHNFCRNPDEDGRGIWCFTTNEQGKGPTWDYCDPKEEDDEESANAAADASSAAAASMLVLDQSSCAAFLSYAERRKHREARTKEAAAAAKQPQPRPAAQPAKSTHGRRTEDPLAGLLHLVKPARGGVARKEAWPPRSAAVALLQEKGSSSSDADPDQGQRPPGETACYAKTFAETGCKNTKMPSGRNWWDDQSDSTVFNDMYAYCQKTLDGTASAGQIKRCCGDPRASNCPTSCTKQTEFTCTTPDNNDNNAQAGTTGACEKGKYMSAESGKQGSLSDCENACTGDCKFYAFCPSGPACTGGHANKCALYSDCSKKGTNGGAWAGYTIYQKGSGTTTAATFAANQDLPCDEIETQVACGARSGCGWDFKAEVCVEMKTCCDYFEIEGKKYPASAKVLETAQDSRDAAMEICDYKNCTGVAKLSTGQFAAMEAGGGPEPGDDGDVVFPRSACRREPGGSSCSRRVGGDADACKKERDNLQNQYATSYEQVVELQRDAHDRVNFLPECHDDANTEKEAALVPLVEARDASTERSMKAAQSIATTAPTLVTTKERLEKMVPHLEELRVECLESDEVSEHLKAVRAMIMNMQTCPGRNGFELALPGHVTWNPDS